MTNSTRTRLARYERLLSRLRDDPRLWDESPASERLTALIKQVKEKVIALREDLQREASVGPYSGLTRQELRKSGTLETDWF